MDAPGQRRRYEKRFSKLTVDQQEKENALLLLLLLRRVVTPIEQAEDACSRGRISNMLDNG